MHTDLHFVLDPGGTGTRPGINLTVYPSGTTPLSQPSQGVASLRLANGQLTAGGPRANYDFETTFTVDSAGYGALQGLVGWSQVASERLENYQVVVYNLVEPFTEIAKARSRYKVPGTSVISQEVLGGGWSRWTYWIAVQGVIGVTSRQVGRFWEVNMAFTEGLVLTADLEEG